MHEFPDLESVCKELKDLIADERLRPEPEYQSFCKYFATFSHEEFLNQEEIVHLINSHGVQLQNDIKYLRDKNKVDPQDFPDQMPVIDPKHFTFLGFNDVVEKLKELPSEWTVIQITKKFSLLNSVRKEESKKLSGIHISRFACGDLAKRVQPYAVTIEDDNCQENIFTTLKSLISLRREYYKLGRRTKKLLNDYMKTNQDLMSFIKELESYLFKQWLCLLHGRLENSKLEMDIVREVEKMIGSFCKTENIPMPNATQLDIIYQLTLSAHFMKTKSIYHALYSILLKNDATSSNIRELKLMVEKLKIFNLRNDCEMKRAAYNPVILIVDNDFETVPWEMITSWQGQPICRISSLHMLYSMFKYHQPHIRNGFRMVEIDKIFCLINPGNDLESCEKEMKEFLRKRIPWAEVECSKAPEPKEIISKFKDYSAYLYCGHGTGMQFLEEQKLKKGFVKGLILLFGCSSNIPKNAGGRTPHQNNTYTYICNGSPCTIGCLQDVGTTDADEACKTMLSLFMPSLICDCPLTMPMAVVKGETSGMCSPNQMKIYHPKASSGVSRRLNIKVVFICEGYEHQGKDNVMVDPQEPNVLKALIAGKTACTKYWSKSAFVARGLPCKTVVGSLA